MWAQPSGGAGEGQRSISFSLSLELVVISEALEVLGQRQSRQEVAVVGTVCRPKDFLCAQCWSKAANLS